MAISILTTDVSEKIDKEVDIVCSGHLRLSGLNTTVAEPKVACQSS